MIFKKRVSSVLKWMLVDKSGIINIMVAWLTVTGFPRKIAKDALEPIYLQGGLLPLFIHVFYVSFNGDNE